MTGEKGQVATDKIDMYKGIHILIIFLGIPVMAFYFINLPSFFEVAQVYWLVGLSSVIGIIIGLLVFKLGMPPNINMPIAERTPIPRPLILIGSFIAFVVTLYFISGTGYSVGTPALQVLELEVFGDILFTFYAQLYENVFFFSVLLGIVFSAVYIFTKKNVAAAFLFAVLLTPLFFLLYHTFVYGFQNVTASLSVYVFGLEMTLMMLIIRDLTYTHARHAGNNLGILLRSVDVPTLIFATIASPVFWGVIAMVVVLAVLRFRRRKKK